LSDNDHNTVLSSSDILGVVVVDIEVDYRYNVCKKTTTVDYLRKSKVQDIK